jgi:hypothetical protein
LKSVLLGAGASYESGMPLVWEFTATLRANVLRRLDTALFDFRQAPALRSTMQSIVEDTDLHYEQMIGKLEALSLNVKTATPGITNATRQLIDCVQSLLVEDQFLTTALLRAKMKDYVGIQNLASENPGLDVFSLNHDVVFEEICRYHKIPLSDGFYEGGGSHYGNIARFKSLSKAQMDRRQFAFIDRTQHGLNLIKLHGSVDVFAVEDKQLYLKCAPHIDAPVGGHIDEVKRVEAHSMNFFKTTKLRGAGELFVQDVTGEMQFFRRTLLSGQNKFTGRFEQNVPEQFFHEFPRRLDSANELDVIGYSFGDTHINNILKAWMSKPTSLMNIFDPRRIDVPIGLALAKVRLVKGGLTKYFMSYESCWRSTPIRWVYRRLLSSAREKLRKKRLLTGIQQVTSLHRPHLQNSQLR